MPKGPHAVSNGSSVEAPVVLFVFNRPDYTSRVFSRIREARPERLLVVADGPRTHVSADRDLCSGVRRLIESGVDWPCALEMNAADSNLGCRNRFVSGLRWVFSKVESAIILEDDCLPEVSFFEFCHALLARYSDDPRVGMIAGTNYMEDRHGSPWSYFASNHHSIWGWATWRRAFSHYDEHMSAWRNGVRPADVFTAQHDWHYRLLHATMFDVMRNGQLATWDIPWVFAMLREHMLSLVPRRNLVSNIGLEGVRGRHADANNLMQTFPADDPMKHPPGLRADPSYDRHVTSRHRLLRDWLRAKWAYRIRRTARSIGLKVAP